MKFEVDDTDDDEVQETVEFEVSGKRKDPATGERVVWTETFTVLMDPPMGVLQDLIDAASVDDRGNMIYNRHAVLRFIRGSLVPDDEARWDAFLRDKTRRIKLDKLGDVMFWIVGATTGRPTGPRPASETGTAGTDGSEADSSSQDTTPPASETSDSLPSST